MAKASVFYSDDSVTTMDALFGRSSAETDAYIAQSVNNFAQAMGNPNSASVQAVMNRYSAYTNAATQMRVANLRGQLDGVWERDAIRHLRTVDAVRRAPVAMQRWVMAMPDLREHYLDDGISAYNNTYIDNSPGGVGPLHYDYRRVMHGIVNQYYTEEGTATRYTNYLEPLITADDALSVIDKAAIIATWDTISEHLDESDSDPTSELNERLG